MLKTSRGFSLIEIMISLILFTAVSLSMMNVLKQTTKAQDQMDKLIRKNRIAANISYVIRKDLQSPMMTSTDSSYLAYHTWWTYLRDRRHTSSKKVESDYITNHLDDEGYYDRDFVFPLAGFEGGRQSFYFTNSHPLLKVGYVLDSCSSPSNERCLIRKTAPIDNTAMDEFPEKQTKNITLLEGVLELNIQYLDGRNKEWTETFKTEYPSNFYRYPLTFPLAVKMDIELKNKDPLSLSIPIHQSILSHKIYNRKPIPNFQSTTTPKRSGSSSGETDR